MQTLLTLLPSLLCPLAMIAMLWLMRRDSTDHAMAERGAPMVSQPQRGIRAFAGALWHGLQCCINWKVGLALGLGGVGVWAVAPELLTAALPLLVVLLCPLSMLLMLWGGHRKQQSIISSVSPLYVNTFDMTEDGRDQGHSFPDLHEKAR